MNQFLPGTKIHWSQGVYILKGTVLESIKAGESMYAVMQKHSLVPRVHTKDVAYRGDRLLVRGDNGNHYTVLECNAYIQRGNAA